MSFMSQQNNTYPSTIIFEGSEILDELSDLFDRVVLQLTVTREGDSNYVLKLLNWCYENCTNLFSFYCQPISEDRSRIEVKFHSVDDAMLFKLTF